MRVLLVDDEEELVSALAERLALRGIEAEWFTSGNAALTRAELIDFDIAVLDMKMPKISGMQLREKLHEKYPQMKFIFLTGYGSAEDFVSVTKAENGSIYLIKPLDIDILIEKINLLKLASRGSL